LAFLAAAVVLVCWQVTGSSAQGVTSDTGPYGSAAIAEQVVGRYQAAAPDLVLDTTTGKLTDAAGQVLEPPIDASSKDVGRFSAAGYVTAVTRSVGLDVIGVPVARTDLVKGYVIVDTKTGQAVRRRVYESHALQPTDL
jgi:hypothetical protein